MTKDMVGQLSYLEILDLAWEFRIRVGEELGEYADASDYIRDNLCDSGIDDEMIDRVVSEISREEGWDEV